MWLCGLQHGSWQPPLRDSALLLRHSQGLSAFLFALSSTGLGYVTIMIDHIADLSQGSSFSLSNIKLGGFYQGVRSALALCCKYGL